MRVVYIHAATADLTDGDAAAIAGARIVQDTSVDRAGLDTLLALLADGDDLLVPKIGHLGATACTTLASLRRAADAGVRVSILQDGLDGAAILRVAELLELLPDGGEAAAPARRPYGHVTPDRVAEILSLSAAGVAVRKIAMTVGLSAGTVMRVRRDHRAAPVPRPAAGFAECLGSAD
ncbi:helix-turn-helix domain-containing protein [Azospirillum sp. Sh1]|uniref:helix-turn-helix domain-containing protein n=1 Tax=Azospirillum sp. Sh1 TaxID=2607285 RepID=UPI0011EC0935|nr:helix-turn-helix domain-containing protein [Azospirillum sp. Sh1]KAA0576717.1 helix-turn-helix domain-containing protein [Azospirillum sp. Sh1]